MGVPENKTTQMKVDIPFQKFLLVKAAKQALCLTNQ